MNKCPNCGKEFEGKFCPDCGTEWQEEKTCPKCGAKLNGSAKFCNECGYSFENKTKKPNKKVSVLDWVKSHLKIVIPVALAVVLIIVLACSIPACIAAQTNGTYYKLKSDGELDKKTYFILSSGKWEDEDGEKGTYKKDGDKIIFFVEFFGETEELCVGTVKDGVLKIKDPLGTGTEDTYISEKHEHKFGEWETKKEATEASDGLEIRTCLCGKTEENIIPASGTEGLSYKLNDDETGYVVIGLGTAQKSEIIIPSKYKDLPVTSIGERAFYECSELTSVTIPDSVIEIGDSAFCGCIGLTNATMGNNVKYIDDGAFRSCIGLTSITIPESVISIGIEAFWGCINLRSITIPNGVTSINKLLFALCGKLTSTTIPSSVNSINEYAFAGCNELKNINFRGTKAQWDAIQKESYWNDNTGDYTVHCTDGDIKKTD